MQPPGGNLSVLQQDSIKIQEGENRWKNVQIFEEEGWHDSQVQDFARKEAAEAETIHGEAVELQCLAYEVEKVGD